MSTRVVTGKVRFNYAAVFEPRSVDGGNPKYSISLIIPKSDKKTLDQIRAAVEAAKVQGASKWGGIIPNDLKPPLRDGDKDRSDDAVYAGSFFINANSTTRPGIVDENVNPILDQSQFYSGCYGRASINFFAYNTNENKGIGAGLQNLQKWEDGEPLGGPMRPELDFKDSIVSHGDLLG